MKTRKKSVWWMLSLTLLFISCSDDDNAFRVKAPNTENLISKGCLNRFADNSDVGANTEDSSCHFTYCDQYGYEGYDESVHLIISEYLEYHGEKFEEKPRVERACGQKLIYCEHLDAENYVPGPYPPFGYFGEYCQFKACDKERFSGYKKLIEFKEYLSTHPGEIVIDNSDSICGEQLIIDKEFKTKPEAQAADFDKAEVAFTLDDSGSMQNEIDDVKKALIDLAPIFVNLGATTKLSFIRMSDINATAKKIKNNGNGLHDWRYQFPKAIGEVEIKKNSNIDDVKATIKKILDDFKITAGFGTEQGLCLSLRHLNDRIIDKFQAKTRYVNIVITDEDEHYQNNSSSCIDTFTARDGLVPPLQNQVPFKDMNNDPLHIESFLYMVMNKVLPKEKDAYGWIGLFYDKDNSNCNGAEQHGETYLEFVNELKNYNVPTEVGDICANNYTKLINDKLINGFLNKVSLKYLYFEYPKKPLSINAVILIDKNDQAMLIDPTQYTLETEGEKHYVVFIEDLKDKVFSSKEIKVNFTYEK